MQPHSRFVGSRHICTEALVLWLHRGMQTVAALELCSHAELNQGRFSCRHKQGHSQGSLGVQGKIFLQRHKTAATQRVSVMPAYYFAVLFQLWHQIHPRHSAQRACATVPFPNKREGPEAKQASLSTVT
jgi:hypothetical protein